jgi:GNAT superfamily N-acetyltransferase
MSYDAERVPHIPGGRARADQAQWGLACLYRTSAAPMCLEPGTAEHLAAVLGLIEDARSWLWTKDTDQWEKPWPDRAARDERVLAGLRNGKTWIVWDGDIAAASVTITTKRNSAVWSDRACTCDLAERAVYVHRLITSRKYAGQGLGAELIDWAGLWGCRGYGARWIRIDVWSSNTALHDYYMNQGFIPCGICADPGYPSGAFFQKPVAGIRVRDFPSFQICNQFDSLCLPPR